MLRTVCATAVVLLLAGTASLTVPAFAQVTPAAIAQADSLREAADFSAARALLERLRADDAGAAVAWRLSRTYADLGEMTEAREARLNLYRKAQATAEAAVTADPKDDEAHLALAIAAGRVALESDTRTKIELSRTVKAHVDRALTLNPQHPAALHVRGRWNYGVADLGFMERAVVRVVYGGLPEASFEAAAQDFERAIRLEQLPVHYLELGRTYLRLGRDAEARRALERVLALPERSPDDVRHRRDARALLGN